MAPLPEVVAATAAPREVGLLKHARLLQYQIANELPTGALHNNQARRIV